MIEITRYKAGIWDGCGQRLAEYSIKAPKDEWQTPIRPCQACMLGLVQTNATIRAVVLLQSATRA
jgi:hypothetical protein